MIPAAAILHAISAATLLGLLLGLGSGLDPLRALLALGGGVLTGLASAWTQQRAAASHPAQTNLPSHPATPGFWGWAAIALFSCFALRSFLWLAFSDADTLHVLSPNNLGDLSLHLCFIRQLVNGDPLWPQNPIFSDSPLTYPLGMDLFNSLLVLGGIDVVRSLVWTGLAACALTGVALWKWGRSFTLAGFLCNGGLAGLLFLSTGTLEDFQSDTAWKSIPLALFVTQRGLLFALPAGLLLLASWRARWFHGPGTRLHPVSETALYCVLPLFHLHTFLFLSLLLASWALFHKPARPSILLLLAAAFLPATALTCAVTNCFHGPSMIGWKPGWMQEDEPFLSFWIGNFGILPFLIAGLLIAAARRDRTLALLTVPPTALFLLCCFVRFAPWEWDNTKFMLWSYLMLLPPLWQMLAQWHIALRATAVTALFFSGFLSLLGGLDRTHTGHPIALHSTLDAVSDALRDLPQSTLFIGAPTYNHPLLLLGRRMTMGYEGHVWSHGHDWLPRKQLVERILLGAPSWRDDARQLGTRHLFWGPLETEAFPNSTRPWQAEARCIASGAWGAVYELP